MFLHRPKQLFEHQPQKQLRFKLRISAHSFEKRQKETSKIACVVPSAGFKWNN